MVQKTRTDAMLVPIVIVIMAALLCGHALQPAIAGPTERVSDAFVGDRAQPGDQNGDNCVNVLDLMGVRGQLVNEGSEINPPSADVNLDGCVNIIDLLIVRAGLGMTRAQLLAAHMLVGADVTGDDIVNVIDMLAVRANLGKGTRRPK